MTAFEHLVLEPACRLNVASSDKIREYVGQLMGHQIVDERVTAVLQSLLKKELLSCCEDASGNKAVRSYGFSGGHLFFPPSTK